MRTRRMRSSPRWSNRGIRAGPIGMAYSPFSFVVVGAALAASSAAFFLAARVAAAFFAAAERAPPSRPRSSRASPAGFSSLWSRRFSSSPGSCGLRRGLRGRLLRGRLRAVQLVGRGLRLRLGHRSRGLGLRRDASAAAVRQASPPRFANEPSGRAPASPPQPWRCRRRQPSRQPWPCFALLGLLGGALLVIAGLALGEALLLAGGS